jgi:hypothetical protein
MGISDLLAKAKKAVTNTASRIATVVSPARVTLLPGVDPFRVVPPFIAESLARERAEPVNAQEVTGKSGPGGATKGPVSVPAGSSVVAVSTDAAGMLQWHLPTPGELAGEVDVWVRREAEAGRRVGVFRLPQPAQALDVLVAAAESLYKVPGMKKLPAASAFPEYPAPLGDPGTLLHVGAGFFQDFGRTDEIAGSSRALLIVHGILDRVYGFALSPLLIWGDLLGRLHELYGGRVYAFDHPTLSKGPLENARDLLALLPDGVQLDILCHSRGGLVTRCLLEHPEMRGKLDAKRIHVGRVIFMAAANQGSRLAAPNHLADMLNVFAGFGSISPVPLVRDTLRAASDLMLQTLHAISVDANALPGVAALIPGNPLIRELNASPLPASGHYSFIRANFDHTTERLLKPVEAASDRGFGTELSDLVVPFDGVIGVGRRSEARPDVVPDVAGLGTPMKPQGHWHHLNLLDSQPVRDFIIGRFTAAVQSDL